MLKGIALFKKADNNYIGMKEFSEERYYGKLLEELNNVV